MTKSVSQNYDFKGCAMVALLSSDHRICQFRRYVGGCHDRVGTWRDGNL